MKKSIVVIAVIAMVVTGLAATGQAANDLPTYGGHYYEIVAAPFIPWTTANSTAAGMTYVYGCPGHNHLLVPDGPGENWFLWDTFGAELVGKWYGGFQDAGVIPADAGWQWVVPSPWVYTAWSPGEPNDAYGPASEQHLMGWIDGYWNDEGNLNNVTGYVVEYEDCEAFIDIKPGSFPNSINLRNNGVIPVALLGGSDTFDVTEVDVNNLMFAGAYPAHDLTDPATYADHLQDVNFDGYMDLVSHYRTQETDIISTDTEACLSGFFGHLDRGGDLPTPAFTGCDSVRIVGR